MKFFGNSILNRMMDKASDDGGGTSSESGGSTGYSESENKSTIPPNDKGSETPEPELDEHGYTISDERKVEIAAEKAKETKADSEKKQTEDSKNESEKVKDPATGYGEEPPKVETPKPEEKKPEDKPEEKKPEEKKPEEQAGDVVLDLNGFSESDAKEINDFVKENKVSEKAAKAWVELRRKEVSDAVEQQANAQQKITDDNNKLKASWRKELEEDKDYGGDNFQRNVNLTERVLADYFPETKKNLTERKGMLPPHYMKELLNLANDLYDNGRLTIGTDPVNTKDAKNDGPSDPLDFYKTNKKE